nr:putative ribonuclease H-like domain-containing protein [Tanacetum cinerariifolium]
YTDSDYAGASLNRKYTTEGCQFLRYRLISWQCKKYTMVANSTIEAEYVVALSCCGQFWSTAKAKTINREAHIHARVDGKKVIILEASIADEEGVDCLPNSTIFEQLTLMGPKTIAWNEFSSNVASAIICLDINQKFNVSKWIFASMGRNMDNEYGKFLMYPRKPTRKVIEVPQPSDLMEHVADEAVYKELDDRLVRVANTASSLEAE